MQPANGVLEEGVEEVEEEEAGVVEAGVVEVVGAGGGGFLNKILARGRERERRRGKRDEEGKKKTRRPVLCGPAVLWRVLIDLKE